MSKKSQDKGMNPYFSKLATQMIMPSMAGNGLVPSPNSTPSQVCVRRIRKTFNVSSASAAYSSGFTVAMFPDLFNPGYVSSIADVLIPVPPSAVSINSYYEWDVAGPSMDSGFAVAKGGDSKCVATLRQISDAALVSRLGYNLTPLAASACSVLHDNYTDSPITLHTMYKVTGGNWTILGTDNIGANSFVSVKYTLPLNTDAIAIVPATTVMGGRGSTLIGITVGQFASPASASLTNAFESFVIDNNIKTGRVISMSLLCTNTSPAIANGGNVSAGRVPHGFNPILNVPQELSGLPENRRYQGPASTGAYVSWMPSQFDEFEIDNIPNKRKSYSQSEYLIVQVAGWAPPAGTTASFVIYCDWLVEFFTPNQVFEKVLTPPRSEEFDILFHALLSMPAATCNPEHGKLVKDLLRKGGESVRSGLQFYDKNKAAINTVLALMMKLLV